FEDDPEIRPDHGADQQDRREAVDVDLASLRDDALRDEDDRQRVRGRPEEERDLPPRVALDQVPVALDHPVQADELVTECGCRFPHANTPRSSLACGSLPPGRTDFPPAPPSFGHPSPPPPAAAAAPAVAAPEGN